MVSSCPPGQSALCLASWSSGSWHFDRSDFLRAGLLFAGVISHCAGRAIARGYAEAGRGDLTARAGVPWGGARGHDEIAELVWDFDTMAERLEKLVNAQSRLLSDISHELRSPLARLNVALALARQAQRARSRKPPWSELILKPPLERTDRPAADRRPPRSRRRGHAKGAYRSEGTDRRDRQGCRFRGAGRKCASVGSLESDHA